MSRADIPASATGRAAGSDPAHDYLSRVWSAAVDQASTVSLQRGLLQTLAAIALRSGEDEAGCPMTISMNGHGPVTLSVTPERDPEGISLRLAGEMDIATASRLVQVARTLSGQDVRRVRLDLAELHFIDASGLSALVQTRTNVLDQGGRLTLHGVRPLLHRLLAITGLSAVFEVEPSLATPTDRSAPGRVSNPQTG